MFYIVHVIETFFFDVSLEQISSTFASFFKMEEIYFLTYFKVVDYNT